MSDLCRAVMAPAGGGRGGRRGRSPVAGWRELCKLPDMSTTIIRLMSSMGLALCLGLTFTPLGCGGTQEGRMESSHHAGEGPPVPADTEAQVRECVNEAKARLTDTVYAMQF